MGGGGNFRMGGRNHQAQNGGDHTGDHRVLGVLQIIATLVDFVEVLQRGTEDQLGRYRNGLQLGLERGQDQPAQRKEQQQRHAPGPQGANGVGGCEGALSHVISPINGVTFHLVPRNWPGQAAGAAPLRRSREAGRG